MDPICTLDEFAALHARYWPESHKTGEAIVWHNYFGLHLESALLTIDKNLTIPYWVCFKSLLYC